MNISCIDSSTNFKAKLVVDKKLAGKLPNIEAFRDVAKDVKSADYIRIRKAANTRYLPREDMYVVIAEKNLVVQQDKSLPNCNKHFFGISTKLLNKGISKEGMVIELFDSMNVALDNLAKKIDTYKKEFPDAIKEDDNLFQKIKSFLKR